MSQYNYSFKDNLKQQSIQLAISTNITVFGQLK